MSEYSQLIIAIWFLPLLLQVVLPLVIMMVWLIFQGSSIVFKAVPGKIRTIRISERRRDERFPIVTMGEVLAHQCGKVIGNVRDISVTGMRIDCVSDPDIKDNESIFLDIEGRKDVFLLRMRPKWKRVGETGITIGAAVVSNSAGWFEFVAQKKQAFAA